MRVTHDHVAACVAMTPGVRGMAMIALGDTVSPSVSPRSRHSARLGGVAVKAMSFSNFTKPHSPDFNFTDSMEDLGYSYKERVTAAKAARVTWLALDMGCALERPCTAIERAASQDVGARNAGR